jgi:hypothetical protein
MADFAGESCFHCQQPFTPEDDIVVCPDCGTPYHRDCWQVNGHCINTLLHQTGGSWQPTQKKKPDDTEQKEQAERTERTAYTGSAQQSGSNFGRAWQPESAADACCGMNPDESYEGERLEDVANFVCNNNHYYLPIFKKFRETGSKFSLNLIGALLPPLYFASRKMWGMAFALITCFALLDIPSELYSMLVNGDTTIASMQTMQANMGGIYSSMVDQMIQQFQSFCTMLQPHETVLYWAHIVCLYLSFALRVLMLFFANYFYYRFVLRRVRKIRAENLPQTTYRDKLRMQGGTNSWYILLAILAQYGVQIFFSAVLLFCACFLF